MKAMTLSQYGDQASFQTTELPHPSQSSIKARHVLVRVYATSVNTVDTMIRQMGEALAPISPKLPALLGMDFAGTVEAVGEGVADFQVGDEVYGCAGGMADLPGALAEYMVADVQLIAHKPKRLTMRQAAALPLVAITAYEGLQRANIQAGQKVLVHGGTGGVGHVAVQLAKHFGGDVYATISGEQSAEVVKQYGATAIDYKQEPVADYVAKHTDGSGFELIFDSVGGANMNHSFEAAALNANIATTVSLLELDLTPAHFKGLSIHVVFMLIPMLHNHNRQEHGAILTKLAGIVDQGALMPLLDENRYALEEVEQAYDRLTSGQAMGKVVVEIQPS